MTVSFFGAAGDVTGSNFLVTAEDNGKMLVDFGMFQGLREVVKLNYQPLRFRPSDIQGVVLTHAHLDHCGRLPLLVFGGFTGRIYMTAPTAALVDVVLNDAWRVAADNQDQQPLYGEDEVIKTLKMIEVVEYNTPFSFGSFRVLLKDAGHILGSASAAVTDVKGGKTAVFSGDLGNSPEDIIRPTEFFDRADAVVMEATYGDKTHPDEDTVGILQEEINTVEKSGGVLLIPAFSLERTQEILHKIHHLKKDGAVRGDTPVFLDSPMGIRATQVFMGFKEFYNDELQKHFEDPFFFDHLVITESVKDSKDIRRAMEPKVIIAGSGMLSGGRIVHHAAQYLPLPSTRLLFVGYQAEETPGRRILEGARNVVLDKKNITIRAQIRRIASFSAHADQEKLLTWLGHIKDVKTLCIIHGDTAQRQTLAEKAKTLNIPNIHLPEMDQVIQV